MASEKKDKKRKAETPLSEEKTKKKDKKEKKDKDKERPPPGPKGEGGISKIASPMADTEELQPKLFKLLAKGKWGTKTAKMVSRHDSGTAAPAALRVASERIG